MNLQTRKIHFVQEFLKLSNEQIIDKLEVLLKAEKTKLYSNNLVPLSVEELSQSIDEAENDATNKRSRNLDALKNEIKSWT
ncbi:MAG: hypothetical protein RIQ70_495 [Bacteroidota bacterium]|jgi:hydrogenase maturation factor HypE